MAKVFIYQDEAYYTMVFPVRDGDLDGILYYLPVEVPDDVLAAYEAVSEAERTIRRCIIENYGESPLNPNYQEEWKAFVAKRVDESEG